MLQNTMGLSISAAAFEQRLRNKLVQDKMTITFRPGDLRGKLEGRTFYFFESGDGPRSFTTILNGKFDEKEITYSMTKHKSTRVMMVCATVLWTVLSLVLFFVNGPIGLLGFVAIPFIVIPFFKKDKGEMKRLETLLKRLCTPEEKE